MRSLGPALPSGRVPRHPPLPVHELVERIRGGRSDDLEVTWQLGSTPAPPGLRGRHADQWPADELSRLIVGRRRRGRTRRGRLQPFAYEVPTALAVIPLWLACSTSPVPTDPSTSTPAGTPSGASRRGGRRGPRARVRVLPVQPPAVPAVRRVPRRPRVRGGGCFRLASRRYVRARQRRGELVQHALILGTDDDARELATTLNDAPTPATGSSATSTSDWPPGARWGSCPCSATPDVSPTARSTASAS
jgi:hypothetical protein